MEKKIARVLVVHPSDELYGADVVLLSLVDGIKTEDIEFYVILPTDIEYDRNLSNELKKRNVYVEHYNIGVLRRQYLSPSGISRYCWRFLRTIIFLRKFVFENRIDIVFSNTLAILPGVFTAFLVKKTHVWHVHEIIERPRFLWRLTAWLAGLLSDKIVVVSNAVGRHLQLGCKLAAKKIKVIHNGIDIEKFSFDSAGIPPSFPWKKKSIPVIGVVGRISRIKGQLPFIEIANQVVVGWGQVHFVFVGSPFPGNEGLTDIIKQSVNFYGLEDQVFFEGFRKDISQVIKSFDILAVPSVQADSFPSVILEAMALAKPVVGYAVGGIVEMVEHGKTGFLVPPGNKAEMAERLQNLLNDDYLRTQMGQAGRIRVEADFGKTQFIQKWKKVLTCNDEKAHHEGPVK